MEDSIIYPNEIPIHQAREMYFANSGFTADTYTDRWVRLPVSKFAIWLPNFAARRKAVPLHDIDHILTEYKTDWEGEWQISAYEMGTGCGTYWAGWMINLQALLMGAFFLPKKCMVAFARGRRSRGVFHFRSFQNLLDENVGTLRQQTTFTNASVKPEAIDILLFWAWTLFALVLHLAPISLGIFFLFTSG